MPTELGEVVRAKVASGEHAMKSEVIRDGLQLLMARDRAVTAWLRETVVPTHDVP